MRKQISQSLMVFLVAFGVYGLTAFPRTPFNEQTRQATALLHGHLSIETDSWLEHAEVGPYKYALHPPLAAFLLVPEVAIYPKFDQGWFGIFVGALDVMLVWILLRRMWLTVFFGFGTIIWYEAAMGTTWALPELVGVGCTLLVLIELFGWRARRPWLVGVYAGLGFLALYQLYFVIPVYAWMLRRRAYWILPGFLVAVAIYVALNEARFGVPYDMGLWLIPGHPGGPRQFGFQYMAFNLYTLLFMAPVFGGKFPYIHPAWIGQSLTLTSPAFVMVLKPYWRRWEMQMMGACAILVAMPMLLCYANGYAQFGARHYIPMYPYLLVMMGQARADQMTKILIVVSIILIGVGIWEIHAWGL